MYHLTALKFGNPLRAALRAAWPTRGFGASRVGIARVSGCWSQLQMGAQPLAQQGQVGAARAWMGNVSRESPGLVS